MQLAPEYSEMYRLESPPLLVRLAVTVKLDPVEIPEAQYNVTLVTFAVGPPYEAVGPIFEYVFPKLSVIEFRVQFDGP